MLTFVPDNLSANASLVVALHGCTQSAQDYAHGAGWLEPAERHGFALLLPQQNATNNPALCFNWFVPEHIRHGSGEAESIRQMIDYVSTHQPIDPDRIFITGLSAGGAMATAMLAAYPQVFAGGAIMSGLPYGCATNALEAMACMQEPQ